MGNVLIATTSSFDVTFLFKYSSYNLYLHIVVIKTHLQTFIVRVRGRNLENGLHHSTRLASPPHHAVLCTMLYHVLYLTMYHSVLSTMLQYVPCCAMYHAVLCTMYHAVLCTMYHAVLCTMLHHVPCCTVYHAVRVP